MKRKVIVILLFSISLCLATEFRDLRGSTNPNGETKLFFRKYNYISYGGGAAYSCHNDVYCFNINNSTYSLVLESHSSGDNDFLLYSGHKVYDYIIDNTLNEISYSCGTEYHLYTLPSDYEFGFVKDTNTYVYQWDDHSIRNIFISNQNPLTLFASYQLSYFNYLILKSENGGIDWTSIEDAPEYILRSIDPQNDQILYCASPSGELYKSADGGSSFAIVGSSQSLNWEYCYQGQLDFVYDNDGQHIYAIVDGCSANPYNIVVSNDNGSNWFILSINDYPMFIDGDLTQSGVIYKSVNSNIYVSYDYGNSFTLFQNLDYDITGLYQVDGTDTIYVITESYLFEVTSSSVNILLSLVAIDEETISSIEQNYLANYPNPFNPSTTIEFSIKNVSRVDLSVYNIKGQKVKTLANNEFERGNHSIIWNGDDESNKFVNSGLYYYKLTVNGNTRAVKKCMLLK